MIGQDSVSDDVQGSGFPAPGPTQDKNVSIISENSDKNIIIRVFKGNNLVEINL